MDELANQLRFFKELGVSHLQIPESGGSKAEGASQPESARAEPPAVARQSKEEAVANPSSQPEEKLPEGPAALSEVRRILGDCQRCPLAERRTHLVFGVGDPEADLMFVGEAPGRDEDELGLAFVGPAGKLLSKIIRAIGLYRDQVYVANILKCRPPGNRDPLPEEVEQCSPFLLKQVESISPKVIVALGRYASQSLLQCETPISALRGNFHDFKGIPLMPTFHPSYLLRNSSGKRHVWEDMKAVKAKLSELGSRYYH